MPTFSAQELKAFASKYFMHWGVSEADAASAADVLVSADMRGVDSHGLIRLQSYYGSRLDQGLINPRAALTLLRESSTTLTFDANNGLGHPAAVKAMRRCIEKARESGVALATVRNSNHYGIAGYYAMMALEEGMIGVSFTNSAPLVAPTHGQAVMLGTNPIAVAIPAGEENAFVGDFATTTAANGKLEILQRKNLDAPLGWVQSREGEPTTNANSVKEGGSLLPLGGDREHSSHKGYILGSLVDIFCGILSGANFGPWVPPFPAYIPIPEFQPGKGIGHFFGAMRIDAFRKPEDFKKDMDMWIRRFKQAVPIHEDQPVVIPGQPELEMEMERKANGIPLITNVYNDLLQLGEKYQVAFNKD